MKKGILIGIVIGLCIAGIAVAGMVAYRFIDDFDNRRANPQKFHQSERIPPEENGAIDTSNFIGEEKAREIAIAKSEISADSVNFDRTELDRDNGVWRYEVEFHSGRTEYDAEIKADDGTILKWEIDYND